MKTSTSLGFTLAVLLFAAGFTSLVLCVDQEKRIGSYGDDSLIVEHKYRSFRFEDYTTISSYALVSEEKR